MFRRFMQLVRMGGAGNSLLLQPLKWRSGAVQMLFCGSQNVLDLRREFAAATAKCLGLEQLQPLKLQIRTS